jgi:ferredoxin
MVSRLGVDREACRGAGQCVFNAPDLFDQDEQEGLVVLLRSVPSAEQLALAERAVAACPNRAISLSSTD